MARGVNAAVPVFVSYSHADRTALERLRVHLRPLDRKGRIRYWDDGGLKPGQRWRQQILQAVGAARVFVLLLSQDFLASDFIDSEELPRILAAAEQPGITVLAVYLKPLRDGGGQLGALQAVNNPDLPLSALSEHEQEAVWVRVQEAVVAALRTAQAAAATADPQPTQPTSSPRVISISAGQPTLDIYKLRESAPHLVPRWVDVVQRWQAGQARDKVAAADEAGYPPGIDNITSLGSRPTMRCSVILRSMTIGASNLAFSPRTAETVYCMWRSWRHTCRCDCATARPTWRRSRSANHATCWSAWPGASCWRWPI